MNKFQVSQKQTSINKKTLTKSHSMNELLVRDALHDVMHMFMQISNGRTMLDAPPLVLRNNAAHKFLEAAHANQHTTVVADVHAYRHRVFVLQY